MAIQMEVAASCGGKGTYGIRVGVNDRRFFDRSWTTIFVEMDGRRHSFKITPCFWKRGLEIRDSGTHTIRNWLKRHRTLTWEKGAPPRMTLVSLGDGKFRLLA
jgi:hypothetical protein